MMCTSPIYCRVPARRCLWWTALAPGSDETQTRDPLVRQQVDWTWHWWGASNLLSGKHKTYAKYLDKVYIMTDYLKLKNTGHTRSVLLRQGEPGMPQYIKRSLCHSDLFPTVAIIEFKFLLWLDGWLLYCENKGSEKVEILWYRNQPSNLSKYVSLLLQPLE